MKRLVLALIAALPLLAFAAPGAAAAQTPCDFVMGFKQLHDAIPAVVGDCLANEVDYSPVHSEQLTTRGLLVWQGTSDGPRFTDGYRTWIYRGGPVFERLNTDRFPWESPAAPVDGAPPVPTPPAPALCVAGSCYYADESFRVFLQDVAATKAGLTAIQNTGGTTLRWSATLPSADLGIYTPATDVVQISPSLAASGEYDAAAVLAHELTHAWQQRLGLLTNATRGDQCFTDERDAYAIEGSVWMSLWHGQLPPSSTPVRGMLDFVATERLPDAMLASMYDAECA